MPGGRTEGLTGLTGLRSCLNATSLLFGLLSCLNRQCRVWALCPEEVLPIVRTFPSHRSLGTQRNTQIACDLVFCVFFAWMNLTQTFTIMDGCITWIVDGDLNTEIFGLTLMKAMSLDEGRTLLASQEIPTLLDLILCNMEFKGMF